MKTEKNEDKNKFCCLFLTGFAVPVKLKLMFQTLAKMLNKGLCLKVEVVGGYLRVGTYLVIFPIVWVLIQTGCLLDGGTYSRIYGMYTLVN